MGVIVSGSKVITKIPKPIVKPPAESCIYIEICPSATAWCNNNQPSEACVPFLDNAENKLMSKINTIEAIKNYINRK